MVDRWRARGLSPSTIANKLDPLRVLYRRPTGERALGATALYAGLRRGELRALAWSQVDFDAGVIRVEWGWDDVEGRIEVKSDAGRRRIPLVGNLRKVLLAHQLATGRRDGDLCFGRSPTRRSFRRPSGRGPGRRVRRRTSNRSPRTKVGAVRRATSSPPA